MAWFGLAAGCGSSSTSADASVDVGPPDASLGATHAEAALETLADPVTGAHRASDFSCLGRWRRPDESRAEAVRGVRLEYPVLEDEGRTWGYRWDESSVPQSFCAETRVQIGTPLGPETLVGGRAYALCADGEAWGSGGNYLVHFFHEVLPNFVSDGVVRTMNHWTPRYERAVLRAAGRDLERPAEVLEVLLHDCGSRFVGGFGVIVTVDGVDLPLSAEQVFRPRLTLPDLVTPYHMESMVVFDVMERVGFLGETASLVIRATGRVDEGGTEVVLGCEEVQAPTADSISIMLSPLRSDYPETHPCRRYL